MEAPNSEMQHICLGVKARLIPRFLKLIEYGFKLKIKTGLTIRELLCGQLGVSADYLDHRIQTIFLDGKAVDDVDSAWIHEGCRIALSAAMPGLVGATFRKGGRYAPFRSSISYAKTKAPNAKGEGQITLKLFNLVAKELGPVTLKSVSTDLKNSNGPTARYCCRSQRKNSPEKKAAATGSLFAIF
jgi:hypothetical protein